MTSSVLKRSLWNHKLFQFQKFSSAIFHSFGIRSSSVNCRSGRLTLRMWAFRVNCLIDCYSVFEIKNLDTPHKISVTGTRTFIIDIILKNDNTLHNISSISWDWYYHGILKKVKNKRQTWCSLVFHSLVSLVTKLGAIDCGTIFFFMMRFFSTFSCCIVV